MVTILYPPEGVTRKGNPTVPHDIQLRTIRPSQLGTKSMPCKKSLDPFQLAIVTYYAIETRPFISELSHNNARLHQRGVCRVTVYVCMNAR